MAYFLPNLGRRYTRTRSIPILLSDTVDTGVYTPPFTIEYRVDSGDWTPARTYEHVSRITLPEGTGDKTVEVRYTDAVSATFTLSQIVTLVEDNAPSYPWYPETQRIANALPQWHIGRRLRSSNWQKFMNIPGMGLGRLAKKVTDLSNALFLPNAPTHEIDLVGRVWPDPAKLNQTKTDTNLLHNPSLTLLHQPFGEPEGWAVSDTGTEWDYDESVTLFGRRSMRCAPGSGERATLVQEIPITQGVGEAITASVYYRTPNTPVPTAVPSSVDFALRLVVLYEDGTSEDASVTLDPETDDAWYVDSVTINPTSNVTAAFLVLNVDHISALGAFNFYVGGLTAYEGDKERDFSLGRTHPHWMVHGSDVDLEPSTDLWLTTSASEFSEEAIPTRLGTASAPDAGVFQAPTVATRAFTVQDALRQSFDLGYLATSGMVGLYETSSNSLVNSYNVAFYDQGAEGFIEVEDFTVEAVTFYNDRLWAIGSFDDQTAADLVQVVDSSGPLGAPVQGGDRLRYLLVLEHRTSAEQKGYLEVVQALPLLVLAAGNPILDMEFQHDDPQWIFYRTATDEYYSRLHFDYGLIRPDGSVWLREPDASVSLL